MNSTNRPYFKGFLRQTRSQVHEIREATESIYRWWWAYLRLSPVLWFALTRGVLPKDKQIAQVIKDFGDVRGRSFQSWWTAHGEKLFAEERRLSRVLQLDLGSLHEHSFSEEKLYLEVPLSIRKQTILKQIKDLLNETHAGRDLDLAATSSANYRLHTKRFRMRTVETEYWVLLYRLLHPDITAWQIGDRLQLAPSLRVRGVENRVHTGTNTPHHKLSSLTGRHLYKAKYAVLHAERGAFPNTSKFELGERHQPFGLKLQTEFREATKSVAGERSEWHQWLHQHFGTELSSEVKARNKIVTDGDGLRGFKVHQRFNDFIAGKSDLI